MKTLKAKILRSRLLRNRMASIGLVLVSFVLLVCLLAPVIARYNPIKHGLGGEFLPPSPRHWFGTDQFGRDVYSRVIWGTRVSLLVGVTTVIFAGLLGSFLGLVSGFLGGRVDRIVTPVLDTIMSFPSTIIAVLVVGVTGIGTQSVIIALSIAISPRFARVVRAQVLTIRKRDFVEAARSLGANNWYIITRHILINVLSSIIVLATIYLPYAIVVEATLSFLGLGVSPETATWGLIISDARDYMQRAYWISIFPGLAILITSLGFNLLGDGLRDVLDPKLRV
jgi:peptide/nickel transport system permease protein